MDQIKSFFYALTWKRKSPLHVGAASWAFQRPCNAWDKTSNQYELKRRRLGCRAGTKRRERRRFYLILSLDHHGSGKDPLAPCQVTYKIQNPTPRLQVPPWPGPPVPVWPPSPHHIPDSALHWLWPALHSPFPTPHLWGSGLQFCRTHPLELSPLWYTQCPVSGHLQKHPQNASLQHGFQPVIPFILSGVSCVLFVCWSANMFFVYVFCKATVGPLKGAI